MASIRAVHDAKHHRDVCSSYVAHAIESLLTGYASIKREYNQLVGCDRHKLATPPCESTTSPTVSTSCIMSLFERLSLHVEELARDMANCPCKEYKSSNATHSSCLELLPMPTFMPDASVGEMSVDSLASRSLRIHTQLKHGEDGAGFATLNSYIVVNEIGDGTTAKVLQVCDTLTSQMFAVKRIQRSTANATLPTHRKRSDANTMIDLQNSIVEYLPNNSATHMFVQPPPEQVPHPPAKPIDNCSFGGMQRDQSYLARSCDFDESLLRDSSNYNFRKEIAIMKKLKHPNLVKLHEVIDDKSADHVYLVMDFVQGGPLLEIDDKTNVVTVPAEPLGPEVIKAQFRCIANAIHYLHRHGIAHLDIKPENILLDERGDPIIIDFGVAHHHVGPHGSPTKFGTPYFFSPEQCEGVPANEMDLFAADVWALGVTLYTMLFRKLPFHAACYPHLRNKIQSNELILPEDCPLNVRDLLTGMLCKDPTQRFNIADVCRHPFVRKASRRRELRGGKPTPPVSMEGSLSSVQCRPGQKNKRLSITKRCSVVRIDVSPPDATVTAHKPLTSAPSFPSTVKCPNMRSSTPSKPHNTLLPPPEEQAPLASLFSPTTFMKKSVSFSCLPDEGNEHKSLGSDTVTNASFFTASATSHHQNRPRSDAWQEPTVVVSPIVGGGFADDLSCECDNGRDVVEVTEADIDNAIQVATVSF